MPTRSLSRTAEPASRGNHTPRRAGGQRSTCIKDYFKVIFQTLPPSSPPPSALPLPPWVCYTPIPGLGLSSPTDFPLQLRVTLAEAVRQQESVPFRGGTGPLCLQHCSVPALPSRDGLAVPCQGTWKPRAPGAPAPAHMLGKAEMPGLASPVNHSPPLRNDTLRLRGGSLSIGNRFPRI